MCETCWIKVVLGCLAIDTAISFTNFRSVISPKKTFNIHCVSFSIISKYLCDLLSVHYNINYQMKHLQFDEDRYSGFSIIDNLKCHLTVCLNRYMMPLRLSGHVVMGFYFQANDRHAYEWERCLEQCRSLLIQVEDAFSSVSSSAVCHELEMVEQGADFLSGRTLVIYLRSSLIFSLISSLIHVIGLLLPPINVEQWDQWCSIKICTITLGCNF